MSLSPPIHAVLFDRDGTLIRDVPYNGDPERVVPMADAKDSIDALRAAGIRVGVVTNQSAIGRGLITRTQVDAVNRRVEELLGPFDVWAVCPHAEGHGCSCRKPAPGLIHRACAAVGVDPGRTLVVGDIASDMTAARSAGAQAVLVPNAATRRDEVRDAPAVRPSLAAVVRTVLGGRS